MEKIFIIDAVNFLFRSYYAIGPMTNDQGESTNALYGFIRSIQKIQKDFSPKYMVAVFDGPDNKKARKQVYAEYKMHRKGAPEDLYLQFERAFEYCEKVGILPLSIPEVEADDAMGSIAIMAKEKNLEIFLCTSDKDLYQLISKNVFVLNVHKNNEIIDAAGVEKYLGVRPDQVVDFLSLMGDASDNIPGVSGFGPKTAASLLNEFGTLEEILAHPEKITGKKQQTLRDEKDKALLSKQLAQLNLSVIIPQDLSLYELKEPNLKDLQAFYQQMKFIKLLQELGPSSESAASISKTKISEEAFHYHMITTERELLDLMEKLSSSGQEICLDTETTYEHPLLAKLVGIGLGIHSHEAFYIPFHSTIDQKIILTELKKLCENPNMKFFGHNIKYDFQILKNYDIEIKNICFDTLLASYLINPHHRRHNLDHLALEFFNKTKISFDVLTKKDKERLPLTEVPLEEVKNYCCEDVDYTYRLKNLFEKELESKNLTKIFQTIELPLLPILAKMERHGIFIDSSHFIELEAAFKKEIVRIEKEIYDEVGEIFNINSPKQLSHILYEKLQLPPPRRKTTEYSTAADVLEKLSETSPIVVKILQYRGLQKLLSTYIEVLPTQINPNTHRIHATFSQSVASTGRLSCQEPNLQNIPIRSEGGEKIRKAFMPEKKGWSYLSSDYSQIELRLLAHFSEDPKLIDAFKNNQDIHTYTASLVFNVPLEKVTKEMRQMAKTVNFGILYGQGAFGLSEQLKIPQKKASELIENIFNLYDKVRPYLDSSIEQAEKTGYAISLFGRKRPILEIHNKNLQVRAAAERLAINTPLQGTAADLIKMAMIAIDQEILKHQPKGFLILQIHDELLFELPDEEISLFKKIVQDKMENIVKLKVPLIVNIEIGKNWGEC